MLCPGVHSPTRALIEVPVARLPQVASQAGLPCQGPSGGGRSEAEGRATWAEKAAGPVPPNPLHSGH